MSRTKTDGLSDDEAVHKLPADYKVTTLTKWGMSPKPVAVKIDPPVAMQTPPKSQGDTMPAGTYCAYAAELLKPHPPYLTNELIVAQMKRIGLDPGTSFDKLAPTVKKALERVPAGVRA